VTRAELDAWSDDRAFRADSDEKRALESVWFCVEDTDCFELVAADYCEAVALRLGGLSFDRLADWLKGRNTERLWVAREGGAS